MLQTQTVTRETLELLIRLQQDPILSSTRLVGGTALSLQIAHRTSTDIDLFTTEDIDGFEIGQYLHEKYGLVIQTIFGKSIIGSINGIKVDVIHHPYEWIDPAFTEEGMRLASIRDIAAMKMHAITRSGTRPKDFVDIAYLGNLLSYSQIVSLTLQKYPLYHPLMLAKALNFYGDVNMEALKDIKMLNAVIEWNLIDKRLNNMLNNPLDIQEDVPLRPIVPLSTSHAEMLRSAGLSEQDILILRFCKNYFLQCDDEEHTIVVLKLHDGSVFLSKPGGNEIDLIKTIIQKETICPKIKR